MPDLKSWGAMELSKLKEDLDRRVASACEEFGLVRAACPEGVARVSQKDGEWVIVCPLPGFEAADVAVTVTGRVLSIAAVRQRGPGGGMARVSQELAMPFPIDQARASLDGGVLTVRLAGQAPPATRNIPVTTGQPGETAAPSATTPAPSETAATDRSNR